MWAWGTSGMACLQCKNAILPIRFSEGVTEEYVRAIVAAGVLGRCSVQFVPEVWFEEHCCLPAEAPKDASGSLV